jgi:hypothetical protein
LSFVSVEQRRSPPTNFSDTGEKSSRGSPEPFDGVAEIYFDSIEALRAATSTEGGAMGEATLREDEAKFIDLTRSPFFVVEINEIYSASL